MQSKNQKEIKYHKVLRVLMSSYMQGFQKENNLSSGSFIFVINFDLLIFTPMVLKILLINFLRGKARENIIFKIKE